MAFESLSDLVVGASSTTTAESTIITPASGKKFRVKSIHLSGPTATVVTFKDGLAGTTVATVYMPAAVPIVLDEKVLGYGIRSTTADNLLTATNGTSATVTMTVRYVND